jgi:hypothetical protein
MEVRWRLIDIQVRNLIRQTNQRKLNNHSVVVVHRHHNNDLKRRDHELRRMKDNEEKQSLGSNCQIN